MNEKSITGTTEGVAEKYALGLTDSKSLKELIQHLKLWEWIAADALAIASKMNEAQFQEFRDGLLKERKEIFAGDDWYKKYSDILLPAQLFKVSVKAQELKAAWGLVYRRMKQLKVI